MCLPTIALPVPNFDILGYKGPISFVFYITVVTFPLGSSPYIKSLVSSQFFNKSSLLWSHLSPELYSASGQIGYWGAGFVLLLRPRSTYLWTWYTEKKQTCKDSSLLLAAEYSPNSCKYLLCTWLCAGYCTTVISNHGENSITVSTLVFSSVQWGIRTQLSLWPFRNLMSALLASPLAV